MKLASYVASGEAMFGAVVEGGLVHFTGRLAGCTSLREAIAQDRIAEMREITTKHAPDVALDAVQWLPVIPDPVNFFAAGVNYRDHVEETGKKQRSMDDGPSFFLRLRSSMAGHGQPLLRPRVSQHFDFEGELALIIGKGGRHIPEDEALSHLAGYTCFMDGSIRDYQKHSVSAGKNFQTTGPLGPWITTADEVPDPTKLQLTTRLNGQVMQHCGLDMLLFPLPFLISYVSRITTLQPGDVIATGTPGGVGRDRKPPVWMKAGDCIEVDINGLGVLSNPIVDEDAMA